MRELVVAADGSGEFQTVQGAVDRASPGDTIRLRPGIYKEALVLPAEKSRLSLRGEDARRCILTFNRSARTRTPEGNPYGTSGFASVLVQADDFFAEKVTFENSAGSGGKVGQAVALRLLGDRHRFRNCRLLGWQDTLYLHSAGRSYFQKCWIEGSVDFIFGRGAAFFADCEVVSREPGYITAPARDSPKEPGGLVFLNCRLRGASGLEQGSVYLGRPWRAFGRAVFLRCWMEEHIRAEGWDNWRDPERERTAFFCRMGEPRPGSKAGEACSLGAHTLPSGGGGV